MVRVHYFGEVEDKAGVSKEELPAKVKTVKALLAYLQDTYAIEKTSVKVAINHNLVSLEAEIPLQATDEIAILSPFAGG